MGQNHNKISNGNHLRGLGSGKIISKLGVFGGTFNPIHIGHLRLAEDVREEFFLDKIVFVPANIPPHKRIEGNASAFDRLEMIKLAIKGNKYFDFDDIEVKRGGVSYTIDTVKYFYSNYEFSKKPFFILGSDQAISINSWKNVDELSRMLSFIVLIRRNERSRIKEIERLMGKFNMETYFFTRRELDITSSEIRERVKNNRSIHYLVKDNVLNYIIKNKLYNSNVNR